MNKVKFYVVAAFLAITFLGVFQSCKKGEDDPAISIYSRKDRLTNTWTLNKYEKNGSVQDISGTTHIYSINNNGTLTHTIEGSIFGFPTRTVRDGQWVFMSDDEDVKITIGSDVTIFNIQRLASKELWLKQTIGADTHVYYYTGL
ncbi:MAG: hypothetical protein Q8R57_09010 [Bacteroidota bacterium]|nr:hypothetical protein [Bacteroidota bacterium]